MADYPSGVYSPRTKANESGVVYTPANTTKGYVEDVTLLDAEVVAIENELGANPKGAYADVVARLNALLTILVTAAPSANNTASGPKIALTANEDQAFGDVGFINSDGEVQLGKADALATASCVVMCADATIDADAEGNYLLFGIARYDDWDWTPGDIIYLSLTGTKTNTLTATAPSGTDEVIQIIGIATHADRILFNTQLVQVEHV